jgi:signal transduction histidine kinase/CHASE3 domain sensor protein
MPDRRARNRIARRVLVFAPAVIVLVTGLLGYGSLRRATSTRDWVIHTRTVLDASVSLLNALLDAESAQRAYLLTRDTTFVPEYRAAAERSETMLARLRTLTRDNPRQQLRLDTLTRRSRERIALIDTTLAAANTGRLAQSVQTVIRGPSRPLMLDVRRLVDSVQAEEARLLVERERDERGATNATAAVIVLGSLVAALLAFVINQNFDRALRDRRVALTDAESANERLQAQALELEAQADAANSAALEAEQAMESAQDAMHAAEASERRAERLQTATEAFSGALSLREVANLIVDQAMAALGADSGLLASLDSAGTTLEYVAARNTGVVAIGSSIDIGEPTPLCDAVRTGKAVLLAGADETRERYPAIATVHAGEKVQAVGAFPMEYNGRVLGALLVRFRQPRRMSSLDVAFMSALSRIAAEAFERARLFDAEREARAAAEAANRAKAAFLASMSHELRTPLQAALGFAQLVRSGVYGQINVQQAEVLGRVERSQTHLALLIDDILDFARIEAGRVRVDAEPVAVGDVFAELAPLVEPQAQAKQIDLALVPPANGLRVRGDRHRLRQILVNLVGNAIKFTPHKGAVRVNTVVNAEHATIQVTDNGTGIPADRLQAIFEPFVQVDEGLTRTQTGVGLGLAISRDLARAMGGELSATSELGKGSIFSVVLRLA